MREILFRGKRVDNGEWVNGYYVVAHYNWHKRGIHKDWIISAACANGGWFSIHGRYPVIADTVGQYTGMIDRNGKKIFEGDIVERYHRFGNEIARMYVVEHRGSWQLWDFDDNDDFLWNWCSPAYCHGEQVGGCIVIGNIHDNPELLEGGENYGCEQQTKGSAI